MERPAFLPHGAETIEPSSSGPQAAAVPQPVRNPAFPGGPETFDMSKADDDDLDDMDVVFKPSVQRLDLSGIPITTQEQYERDIDARFAPMEQQIARALGTAPSQLQSQTAPIPNDPFSHPGDHDEEGGGVLVALQEVSTEIEVKYKTSLEHAK